VSSFRLSGVEGVVALPDQAAIKLEEIMGKADAGIIMLTSDLALNIQERITAINLNVPETVVIEIPGIDDTKGLNRSVMSYVSEALGISL